MRRLARPLASLLVLAALVGYLYLQRSQAPAPATPTAGTATSGDGARSAGVPDFLPREARATLALIARGGPFPHAQDGATFGNYEHLLPAAPRGYYREYTVATPGARDRGARRIVAGGSPPVEYFYTDDHYRSFRRFTLPP